MKIDTTATDQPTIVVERTFDAPRALVWTALTEPKHVMQWYGGRGFENPVCEMDVRPGGLWRHVMRTPDGTDHALAFVFVEVVEPEKLVWKSVQTDEALRQGHLHSVMTVTLADAGSKTKWKLVARFSSNADREFALRIGFTGVLSEGAEKLNDIVKQLRR